MISRNFRPTDSGFIGRNRSVQAGGRDARLLRDRHIVNPGIIAVISIVVHGQLGGSNRNNKRLSPPISAACCGVFRGIPNGISRRDITEIQFVGRTVGGIGHTDTQERCCGTDIKQGREAILVVVIGSAVVTIGAEAQDFTSFDGIETHTVVGSNLVTCVHTYKVPAVAGGT